MSPKKRKPWCVRRDVRILYGLEPIMVRLAIERAGVTVKVKNKRKRFWLPMEDLALVIFGAAQRRYCELTIARTSVRRGRDHAKPAELPAARE